MVTAAGAHACVLTELPVTTSAGAAPVPLVSTAASANKVVRVEHRGTCRLFLFPAELSTPANRLFCFSGSVPSRFPRRVLHWAMSLWRPVSMWPADRKLRLEPRRRVKQRWRPRKNISLLQQPVGIQPFSPSAGCRCLVKQMIRVWRQQEERNRHKPFLTE